MFPSTILSIFRSTATGAGFVGGSVSLSVSGEDVAFGGADLDNCCLVGSVVAEGFAARCAVCALGRALCADLIVSAALTCEPLAALVSLVDLSVFLSVSSVLGTVGHLSVVCAYLTGAVDFSAPEPFDLVEVGVAAEGAIVTTDFVVAVIAGGRPRFGFGMGMSEVEMSVGFVVIDVAAAPVVDGCTCAELGV